MPVCVWRKGGGLVVVDVVRKGDGGRDMKGRRLNRPHRRAGAIQIDHSDRDLHPAIGQSPHATRPTRLLPPIRAYMDT